MNCCRRSARQKPAIVAMFPPTVEPMAVAKLPILSGGREGFFLTFRRISSKTPFSFEYNSVSGKWLGFAQGACALLGAGRGGFVKNLLLLAGNQPVSQQIQGLRNLIVPRVDRDLTRVTSAKSNRPQVLRTASQIVGVIVRRWVQQGARTVASLISHLALNRRYQKW